MDFREESWMIRYGKSCEKGDIHEIGCFPSFILEETFGAEMVCMRNMWKNLYRY